MSRRKEWSTTSDELLSVAFVIGWGAGCLFVAVTVAYAIICGCVWVWRTL